MKILIKSVSYLRFNQCVDRLFKCQVVQRDEISKKLVNF